MAIKESSVGEAGKNPRKQRECKVLTTDCEPPSRFDGLLELLHQLNQLCNLRYSVLCRGKLDVGASRAVTLRQVQVLGALSEEGPIAQTQICAATGIDRSTMSVILRRLSNSGLISRRRSSADNRVVGVSITRRGRLVRMMGNKVILELEREMLLPLSEQTRGELLNGLSEIVKGGRLRR